MGFMLALIQSQVTISSSVSFHRPLLSLSLSLSLSLAFAPSLPDTRHPPSYPPQPLSHVHPIHRSVPVPDSLGRSPLSLFRFPSFSQCASLPLSLFHRSLALSFNRAALGLGASQGSFAHHRESGTGSFASTVRIPGPSPLASFNVPRTLDIYPRAFRFLSFRRCPLSTLLSPL